MHYNFLALAFAVEVVTAFPFMGYDAIPNAEAERVAIRQLVPKPAKGCPYNDPKNHVPAVPLSDKYPYLGAVGTLKAGTGKGGILVPAPGDVDHRFIAPNFTTDIRGPCPGLNAAANHGFLARDGITTFDELVAAQQNMYNAGQDLAIVLAVAGVELDGDTVTGRMSLGCDATSRTATLPLLGDQPGLNGHNKFEADTSLTRNDIFTAKDFDNYRFNGTLFQHMLDYCEGNCSVSQLALYRHARWNESQAENENFNFGPGALLMYGAASFLYELFPGMGGTPDEATMASFFGAEKQDGKWVYVGERIPDGWRNRVDPYTLQKTGGQIQKMFQTSPVQFGGNVGPGNFNGQKTNITNLDASPEDFTCFLLQTSVGAVPSEVNTVTQLPIKLSSWAAKLLAPQFQNAGCPALLP